MLFISKRCLFIKLIEWPMFSHFMIMYTDFVNLDKI